jgi:hypothetical protein
MMKTEEEKLIASFETDPAKFIALFLDRDLSKKQIAFVDATKHKKHILAIWSRQTGKSTVLASYIVWRLLYGKGIEINGEWMPEKIAILAPIKENLKNIYDKIRTLIDKNEMISSFIQKINSERIITVNGNQAAFMSASPGAHIRGYTATCIVIDESQDITDNKYSADIMPFGATTNALVIEAGTPKTKNHFYQSLHAKSVTVIKQPWYECPFLSEEYVMAQKEKSPETLWRQEFLCEFIEEGVLAFPSKLFEPELDKHAKLTGRWNLGDYSYLTSETELTREYINKISSEIHEGAQFAFGLDLGRQNDNSVLAIFRTDLRPIVMYGMIVFPLDTKYMTVAKKISLFHKVFQPGEFNVDYTNEKGFIETLNEYEVNVINDNKQKRGAIAFTQKNKSEMVNNAKMMLEKYLLQLPKENEMLISQFLNQQYEMSESGKYKFYHPSNEHDDCLWASLLALKNITMFSAEEITTFVNPWEKRDKEIHGEMNKTPKEVLFATQKSFKDRHYITSDIRRMGR